MEISGKSLSSKGLASFWQIAALSPEVAEDTSVGIPDSGRMTGHSEVISGPKVRCEGVI